ncbi:MAG: TlpA family protein disulfide reductase [Bdellovibrionales bacterium]|nr:TlpA family protein disulfide reductase [Bdellovibrionales bacterium]
MADSKPTETRSGDSLGGFGAGFDFLRLIKVLVIFGIPLLGVLYFFQFAHNDREFAVPFKPFRAPVTQVEGPDGRKVPLTFKSSVTVVNFWATWCPPCLEEYPAMIELQRELEGHGIDIVFVSIDDSWAAIDRFMAQNRIVVAPGRLWRDPGKEQASAWGSDKFPESYVVRRDGWVVEKIVGAQQWTRPQVIEYFEGLAKKFENVDVPGKSR